MSNQKIEKDLHRNILLNPGPATTSARVKSALLVADICPREAEFGELLGEVQKKLIAVVNGRDKYESVLFSCSGTGVMEACLSSCVQKDESILIIENGAYGKRMYDICQALEIDTEYIKFNWGEEIDLRLVEDHLKTTKAKVIAFIHHETTTGILNPLAELNQLAKKYKLSTLVDCMSSYAGIEIDLMKDSIDYLLSSSNKCIQGMAGIGIVIISKTELMRIKDIRTKNYYFNLYENYISQKNKKQFLFTPPVQLLYCLNTALDEFFDEGGVRKRAKRYAGLYEEMHQSMMQIGFKPLLKSDKNHSKILTSYFEPESSNYSFEDMHNYFYERGITIYPGKVDDKNTFRISNIGDLLREDIISFLKIMSEYVKSRKIF